MEGHVEGGLAQKLAEEGVVVGDVVETVVVTIEAQPNDAKDEDLPKVHAGAPGGVFVGGLNFFEDGKDVPIDLWSDENPLKPGKDGRKFVASFGGDFDFFDGDSSEGKLDVE